MAIFGNIARELIFQICFLVQHGGRSRQGKKGVETEKKNSFIMECVGCYVPFLPASIQILVLNFWYKYLIIIKN